MKDAMGQPVAPGDRVAFVDTYHSVLAFGHVMSFTPKNIRVMPDDPSTWNNQSEKGLLRTSERVIKITEQTKYFAKNHPELII